MNYVDTKIYDFLRCGRTDINDYILQYFVALQIEELFFGEGYQLLCWISQLDQGYPIDI